MHVQHKLEGTQPMQHSNRPHDRTRFTRGLADLWYCTVKSEHESKGTRKDLPLLGKSATQHTVDGRMWCTSPSTTPSKKRPKLSRAARERIEVSCKLASCQIFQLVGSFFSSEQPPSERSDRRCPSSVLSDFFKHMAILV